MKVLYTVLALILLTGSVLAQEPIEVKTEFKEMSQGEQASFTVFVPESDIKLVESEWKKYANNRSIIENITKGAAGRLVGNTYKTIANAVSSNKELEKNREKLRVKRQNDELVVENIVHEHLTQNLLDIYARMVQLKEGTQVYTFFRFADSVFISEENVDEDMLLSIENYIYEFGVGAYSEVVKNQINDAEKELRRMNVVLNNMEVKNESFHKSIVRSESEIDKCESDISQNKKQLKRVIDDIDDIKKETLEYKKETAQYESLKELLKERKKDKKKIIRENKRLKSKIKRQDIKIKNALSDIVENEIGQKQQKLDIETQEEVVSSLQLKLDNIR